MIIYVFIRQNGSNNKWKKSKNRTNADDKWAASLPSTQSLV